jgi:hypothetical protein
MSNAQPETVTPSPAEPSIGPSPELSAALTEAKNTRDVLIGFRNAVSDGNFAGEDAMSIAKGLAFLDAIIAQNQAHVAALEAQAAV